MAASNTLYSGDGGTTDFAIGFTYTSRSFVKAYVGGVITTAWSFLNNTTIRFTVAPPAGTNNVEIRRVTATTPLVDFVASATITDTDLDLVFDQLLDLLEENQNYSIVGMQQSGGNWDATSDRLVNLATPLASTDGATKGYVDTVIGSVADAVAAKDDAEAAAADALAQAGAAAASASSASSSASAAASSLAILTGVYPTTGMTSGYVLKAAGAADVDAVRAELKEFISSADMAATTVDVALTGGYAEYEIIFEDWHPVTANTILEARFSIDGGSTYIGGASQYAWVIDGANSGSTLNAGSDAANEMRLTSATLTGSAGLRTRRTNIRLTMGNGTYQNVLHGHGLFQRNGGGHLNIAFTGELLSSMTRATHIRFFMSSGDFNAGTVKLYGITR